MFAVLDDAGYRTLLALHIITAMVWVGGGVLLTLQAERARRARDEDEYVKVAMGAEFWGTRVFIPSSIVLLACGLGMVSIGHVGFGKPFVDVGLAGWALSFLIGSAFLGPQSGKVKELLGADGSITPLVVGRVNRILWVARADLVILLAVVVNMAVKPGGGL